METFAVQYLKALLRFLLLLLFVYRYTVYILCKIHFMSFLIKYYYNEFVFKIPLIWNAKYDLSNAFWLFNWTTQIK